MKNLIKTFILCIWITIIVTMAAIGLLYKRQLLNILLINFFGNLFLDFCVGVSYITLIILSMLLIAWVVITPICTILSWYGKKMDKR